MSNSISPSFDVGAEANRAQAIGALAVGALAFGALALGALAIGRLAIGRSRIRRLEIDELVVRRVHSTERLTTPSAVANDEQQTHFNEPTSVERFINKLVGVIVGLGLGRRHNYLVQVRGRKTGRIYSTPVNVIDRNGKRYLVAPRGHTDWVRNARASGTVSLKRGWQSEEFALRLLPDDERPEVLKSYLDRYRLTVQRYFPVPVGSAAEAFLPFSKDYPVFELISRQAA
jgi:deazaflavin-dependent oxidoreductase (nitroreductase family)